MNMRHGRWAGGGGSSGLGGRSGRVVLGRRLTDPKYDPVSERGAVMCFDEVNARLRWQLNVSRDERNRNLVGSRRLQLGICFSPTVLVVDGKVYAGNSKGAFFVFATGRELEVLHQTSFGEAMCGSPVAANGVLYVATYSRLRALGEKK